MSNKEKHHLNHMAYLYDQQLTPHWTGLNSLKYPDIRITSHLSYSVLCHDAGMHAASKTIILCKLHFIFMGFIFCGFSEIHAISTVMKNDASWKDLGTFNPDRFNPGAFHAKRGTEFRPFGVPSI